MASTGGVTPDYACVVALDTYLADRQGKQGGREGGKEEGGNDEEGRFVWMRDRRKEGARNGERKRCVCVCVCILMCTDMATFLFSPFRLLCTCNLAPEGEGGGSSSGISTAGGKADGAG